MTVERSVRGLGGFFVVLSVVLAHYHSPYWLFFTAFVGLNLLQSALTDWCPAMTFLRRLGLKDAGAGSCCCGHPDEQKPVGKE
jgi:hypothetical protein